MAASSSSCFSLLLVKSQSSNNTKMAEIAHYFSATTLICGGYFTQPPQQKQAPIDQTTDCRSLINCSVMVDCGSDLVVRNAAPEAAATVDLLSSFSLPSIPGISDSPLIALIAGLTVGLPFVIQRLLTLTKEIDMAAETVEKIADAVGKVADEVDKAAEGIAESLPEGGLKKMVHVIEDLAEETAKDAQKVEDLMDKVEELDDKLEAFLEKQSKGPGKA
ncbi:hypothetical protein MIMGU_mgv1a026631mg [Erythranthe guttata]|uniref:Uncharacterized protein n=1 Tax=Erythranthe guttata TaxID=4155 RepID=A0A022RLE5_ERYGU|nr:hypothetical protein MIMGU_mgv1a026631mg [Erythranthe guttata]